MTALTGLDTMLSKLWKTYPGTIALLLFLLSGYCLYQPSAFITSEGDAIHRWWTPLISMFLSVNGWHLLMNGLVVLLMGSRIELLVSKRFLLFFFFSCCYFGAVFSAWLQPTGLSLGSSAFCYGGLSLFLYLLWWAPERSAHLSTKSRSLQTFLLIYVMVLGCLPHQEVGVNVDIVQHFTGVIVGFMLSLFLSKSGNRLVFGAAGAFKKSG